MNDFFERVLQRYQINTAKDKQNAIYEEQTTAQLESDSYADILSEGQGSKAEKAKSKPKPAAGPNYGGMPRYTHVVQSTLEGGHTHTESSMTGEEACPPPQTEAKGQPVQAPAANAGSLLSFEGNSVLQGILYAEILGKPKALQRK